MTLRAACFSLLKPRNLPKPALHGKFDCISTFRFTVNINRNKNFIPAAHIETPRDVRVKAHHINLEA